MSTYSGQKGRENLRKKLILYAVTDRHWLKEGERLADKVIEAIEGGASFVQLREKEMDEASLEAEAIEIRDICRQYNVPFVIDDDVMLAKKLDCDGVHVGQEDMEADEVRRILGPDKILGVTAKTVEQALLAQSRGADYLGVGAVFSSGTKPGAISCSPDTIKQITAAVDIPCIAIGGINEDNIMQLSGLSLAGIAAVSAIFSGDDVRGAAARLREKAEKVVQGK